MKKYLQIIFVLILASGIVYETYVFFNSETKPNNSIPEIQITLLDNSQTSLDELGKDQHTVVFIFRSNCDYCKKETESVGANIDQFENTEIVFLSFENVEVIEKYKNTYLPADRPYLTFGKATQKEVVKYLNHELVFPYMLWYDKDGNQKAQHRGLFPVERILEVINNS